MTVQEATGSSRRLGCDQAVKGLKQRVYINDHHCILTVSSFTHQSYEVDESQCESLRMLVSKEGSGLRSTSPQEIRMSSSPAVFRVNI